MGLFDDVLNDGGAKKPAPISAGSGLFDDVLSKPDPSSTARRVVGDTGISLLKGAISVPEAAVGIADLATGGYAGKAAEAIGFRPKEAKATLDEFYTPEQKEANRKVQEAKGFLPTIGAAVENPSVIAQTVAESLPSMGAGAVLGRGALALAPKLGAVGAGAIGEGGIGAGLAAEGIRQQTADGTLSAKQAGAALASGVGTAALGAAGGKIAQKAGIGDIDTLLVGGTAQAGTRSLPVRMAGGAVSEGLLEELPQSMQEQAWQNVALDRPVMEGVPEAGALGALAGGVMGIGGGIISGPAQKPAGALSKTVEAGKSSGAVLALPNLPNETLIVFPDGSTGTRKQMDEYIAGLSPEQRPAVMAKLLYGDGTPPSKISDPAAINAEWNQFLNDEANHQIGRIKDQIGRNDANEKARGVLSQVADEEGQQQADVAPAEAVSSSPAVNLEDKPKAPTKGIGGDLPTAPTTSTNKAGSGLGRVLTALETKYEAAKTAGDNDAMRKLAHEINTERQHEKAPKAEATAEAKAPVLSLGAAPNSAEPITVKNGVVHVGKYAAQDFDSGDDVKVDANATPHQIRDALQKAGVIGKGQKVFGLPKDDTAAGQNPSKAEQTPSKPDQAPPDLITLSGGRPYTSENAAKQGAKKNGVTDTHEVVPADDGKGFVLRRKAITQEEGDAQTQPVDAQTVEKAVPADVQLPAGTDEKPETAPAGKADAGVSGARTADYYAVIEDGFAKNREAMKGFKIGDKVSYVARGTYPQKDGTKLVDPVRTATITKVQDKDQGIFQLDGNISHGARFLTKVDGSIDAAAHEAASSPQNDKPEPTDAQKQAGNYAKGHVTIAGLDIAIENPEGSTRSGTDPSGKAWSITLQSHYGYFKRTEGKDGDQVDVFIKPGTPTDYAGPVFVVDQVKANGQFDEHKVMLGFADIDEAKAAYRANYAKGWQGLKAISTLPMTEFKEWLATGDTTKIFAPITEAKPAALKETAPELSKPAATGKDSLQVADTYAAKWFGSSDKAIAFLKKQGIEATHRTSLKDGKWLILPKSSSEAEKTANRAKLEATKERHAAEKAPPAEDLGAMFDDLMGEIGAGAEVSKAANRNKLAETKKARAEKKATEQPRFGSGAAESLSQAESELRALAFDKVKTTGAQGDVKLANGRYVTFDDAMRYVREAVAAGVKPVPFQIHAKLDIAIGETDRLIAALNPQKKPVTPQIVPAATSRPRFGDAGYTLAMAEADLAEMKSEQKAQGQVGDARLDDRVKRFTKLVADMKAEAAPRAAGEAAVSAAKNAAEGFQNAISGLSKLFGGNGRLSSGLTFDEETYQQAKPLFAAAAANFKQAGADLKDVMKAVMLAVREQFGDAVLGNMKPYVVRFVEDVRDGKVDYAGSKEPTNASDLQTNAVPERGADEAESDAATGDRDRESLGAGLAGGRVGTDRSGAVPGSADQSGTAGEGSTVAAGNESSGPARDHSGARAESGAASSESDHVIDADDIGKGGLTKKYRDNVAAIKIIKAMEAEGRVATPEERKQIARYVGWGAIKGVFDPANKQWAKQHAELKALLTDAEFAAARKSTLDAHYTSPVVVNAMYSAMERLGFTGGRLLEPSVGVGNFFGLMPSAMRGKTQLHGVELDSLTARLVSALYPKAKITQGGFEDFSVPAEYFDAVIGNPPFGSQPLVDAVRSAFSGFSIHNYFLAKGIHTLRPGGIMQVVVSHNFLDAQDSRARDWIAARADLIGAVRLPNTAFKENAGTDVVTDILIFQKRAEGQPAGDQSWLKVADQQNTNPKTGESVTHKVNAYFVNNPGKVLGTPSAGGTMYAANEYTVTASGDIEDKLIQWELSLPEKVFTPIERKADSKKTVDMAVPDGIKEGSFYVADNGDVMQRGADLMGEKTSAPWTPKNAKAAERMKGMIALRDTLRQQMRLERSLDATEGQIEGNRQKMNALYDRFLKDFGHLNNTTNRGIFLDDTEAHLLQALEFDYDKGVGAKTAENEGIEPREPSAIKADIFDRRVAFPPQDSMVVTTAKDALLASLNYRGKVDPDYMAEVYQKPIAEIVKELDTLLFEDPQGGLATADEYLSGDVKTKLAEAVEAAKTEPKYRRNVEELEKVIPADKSPSEIAVNIGAPYVPTAVYQQFIQHISGGSADLSYIRATGQWSITFGHTADPALNTGKFGTSDLSAQQLFVLTTLGRGAVVKVTVKNADGSTTTYVKEKETEAAREKQNAIKAEWQKWLWEDAERADQIASIYNDKMNRIVNRPFDGSHLTFPGMNPGITLLEHQKNGVWRGLQSFQTLYDHVVGAGKTFVMATLAMEMRRIGVSRKPLFVVPNHLTMQWRSEFTRLYPGSNVLAATPEDFAKGKRERLFSKMVTGDWDAIVIGHSSLKKIGLPEATEKAVLEEQIKELSDAIEETKRARGDRNIIRDMEGIKARLEAKMKNRLAAIGARDKVLTFDELGIDAMFVDEMHEFKNLNYNSTMDRVAGMGNPNGSSKAFDMFVKVRWLFDTFGEQTPFITATGTPVSNSLVEMFNMQRYMQYPSLKRDGLNVFDAWARQFGKVESVYEVAPSGSGYRQSSRFSKFTNLPALMGLYNTFADTITLDDLKAQEEAQGKVFPVPRLVGGKPQNIVAQRSPQVAALMGVPKAETNEQGEILFNVDLAGAIEIKQDEKSGKYSIKVGDAHLGQAETEQEARLKVVESALSPKITVDPQSILGRFGNLRQLTKESKGKINALSLTGEANKAGLDFRLINPAAPDFPGSKINLAVGKMIEVYHQWEADKGAQLVFCDLSIPLSARSSYESQARRLYVKVDGELAMKRGTMHTAEGFESLPFFIIPRGEKEAKRFDVFDAASGIQLMSEFRTKADAKDAAIAAVTNEAKRQKWIDARHAAGEIEQEAIDDYNNDNEVETEGAEFFTREDIAGVSGASKFSVYDDIKAKLMAKGVPEREIAFIHDYSTPTAKAKLFAAVNTGEVRFLLGSTPKMGAGTNVQKRLVGLHHIDAPWRPSDLEQREGRIIRRGNELYARDPEGFEVFIGRYATEQTYDTRRWQILEHKARGIEQLRNYDGTINEIDDIEGEAANSADMKAAASGDPLILEETRARNDVHRLEQLQSGHADEVLAMNRKARFAEQFAAEEGPKRVAQLEGLIKTANQHPVKPKEFSPVAVNGKQLSTKEGAEGEIVSAFEAVRAGLSERAQVEFRGMKFNVSRPYSNSVVVSSPTDGSGIGTWTQSEAFSPSGFVQRLHNYVDRLPAQLSHVKAEIAKEIKNAAAMREQAKQPFAQAGELVAAREAHKSVQRALLRKGPTVPESQKPAVTKAIAQQKARLEALGFGDAVRELMGSKGDDADLASRSDEDSRGQIGAGQSVAAVRAEIGAKIGKARLAALDSKKLIRIHETTASLPEEGQAYPDTWGWFDGKQVHLVAANLGKGQAAGVFEHEFWHMLLRSLRLSESPLYAKILDRLGRIEQNGAAGKWFTEAEAMIPAEDRGNARRRLNELAAYAIQQYENEPKSLPVLIRRFVQDLIASVRAFFMDTLGWVPDNLTAPDLAALTRRYVKSLSSGETGAGPMGAAPKLISFSRLAELVKSPALQAFLKVATNQDAFQYGTSRSKDLATVLRAVGKEQGGFAAIGIAEDGGNNIWVGGRNADGTFRKEMNIIGAETKTPYVVIEPDQKQTTGQGLYQSVMTWAHNNGKTLKPDSTLTAINRLRRNEAMISSMLRQLTSKHVYPSEWQFVGLLTDAEFKKTLDAFGEERPQGDIKRFAPEVHQKLLALRDQHFGSLESHLSMTPAQDRATFESRLQALIDSSVKLVERRDPNVNNLWVEPTGEMYVRRNGAWERTPVRPGSVVSAGLAARRGVGRASLYRAALAKSASSGFAASRSGGTVPDVGMATRPDFLAENSGWREALAGDNAGLEGVAGARPFYSRSAAGTASGLPDSGLTVQAVTDRVTDLFQTSKTFGIWHKTVGTQFHKASVDKDFGRVFKIGQKFLQDTSQFAMDAADLAPSLLPKLGSIKDVFKRGPKKADLEAVSKVVFQGTLDNKRYTRDELRAQGMNDQQIKLYREFRRAINKSIDDLFVSEMTRQLRSQFPELGRRLVGMSGEDANATAIGMLNEALDEQKMVAQDGPTPAAKAKAERAVADLKAQIKQLAKQFNKVQKLKDQAYAPLTRFGQYTVDVVQEGQNGEPERVFFGMYESEREANAVARKFKADPAMQVSQGVMSQEDWRMFQGVSPDSLELFADALGADESDVFQKYLKLTLNNRSAMKRLIHRQGIAGFSQDVTRVLATFITSNSRLSARNLNLMPLKEAVEAIPKGKGDVKDEAVKLAGYLTDPKEEAQALRGWMFVHFIGGSVASALTNMTQPLTMTAPYLAQWGAAKAGSAMKYAAAAMGKKSTGDKVLDAALDKAESEGITAPHEIHQLYAESIRTLGSNAIVRKGLTAWGQAFALAEAFNRRITFIAAFKMAQQDPALGNPFAFAERAVEETQGIYNKGNRPDWARGSVGATIFTFKQFSISYVEFLKRLPPKQRALALAILFLAAGLQGWPFAEDVQDLIDTIGQSFGYNTNSKRWMHEFAVRQLGSGLGEFATNGFSAIPGMPLDVQARMGLGNLIPGTSIFKMSEKDKSRDVLEFVGPVGALIKSGMDSFSAAQQGRFGAAGAALMPVAIRNFIKAGDMVRTGEYRDTYGKKVVDVSGYDAAIKAVGFQPSAVARESRGVFEQKQSLDMVERVESSIADRWAKGVNDNDPGEVRKARADLAEWNAKNPESRIVIVPRQIAARVKAMRQSRQERFIKSAPPEQRRMVAEDLRGGR